MKGSLGLTRYCQFFRESCQCLINPNESDGNIECWMEALNIVISVSDPELSH